MGGVRVRWGNGRDTVLEKNGPTGFGSVSTEEQLESGPSTRLGGGESGVGQEGCKLQTGGEQRWGVLLVKTAQRQNRIQRNLVIMRLTGKA